MSRTSTLPEGQILTLAERGLNGQQIADALSLEPHQVYRVLNRNGVYLRESKADASKPQAPDVIYGVEDLAARIDALYMYHIAHTEVFPSKADIVSLIARARL